MTPHGTRSRYIHGRCRCDMCTAANRRYNQARKRQRDRETRIVEPAYNLPVAPDVDRTWMDNAACRGRTDLFFPTPGSGHSNSRYHDAARTICRICPVRTQCAEYAVAINARHGIWAGQNANELQAS